MGRFDSTTKEVRFIKQGYYSMGLFVISEFIGGI